MFLSIMGMCEYDPTVFKGLNIPDGVDRDALINNICLQCAELELIYPTIETMKIAITAWSVANVYTWDKLYKTMNLDYNPIWNVDADERETGNENSNRGIIRNNSGTNNETINITDTESVKGFNSDSWSESNKLQRSGTDNFTVNNNENVSEDTDRASRIVKRRTGNIGVTTTQSMIQQEREIAEFSIINYITLSFKERFCLLVY